MKVFVGSLILVAGSIATHAQEPKVLTPMAPLPAAKVMAEIAGSSERAVKNSPFSAEAISESVQTLADGNRIVHSSTTKLYRNSEGRTRREMVSGSGGSLGTGFSYSYNPSVTILDPVGGNRYLLDEKLKTAEQMVLKVAPQIQIATAISDEQRAAIEKLRAEGGSRVQMTDEQKAAIEKMSVELKSMAPLGTTTLSGQALTAVGRGFGEAAAGFSVAAAKSRYETKTEQLGTQNIEGVEAEGTRTTTIIPAGAIGNDRPIETVYEKWYSKELQLVVMSKNTDPRFGEQTYRLTNINRSEPDPSLFSLPTGYRIVTEPGTTYRVNPAKADNERVLTVKAAQSAATVKNKP